MEGKMEIYLVPELRGFTQVPNNLILSNKISAQARFLYIVLLQHGFQKKSCFPSQERIAEIIGVSTRTLRGYIKELKTKGFIEIVRPGLGKKNVYILRHQARSEENDTSGPEENDLKNQAINNNNKNKYKYHKNSNLQKDLVMKMVIKHKIPPSVVGGLKDKLAATGKKYNMEKALNTAIENEINSGGVKRVESIIARFYLTHGTWGNYTEDEINQILDQ